MENKIVVSGKIVSINYSHEYNGENFYRLVLECYRESKSIDYIPVVISENVFNKDGNYYVCIDGSVRTRNVDGHLDVYVFANELDVLAFNPEERVDINELTIEGNICKKSEIRQTPFGRTILDLTLASNRNYNKSDYLPLIVWGRNAKTLCNEDIGEHIIITGRFQSRNYVKNEELKTAYEISVQNYKVI